MSAKVKKAGKFTGKAIGMFVFAVLFAFNIQIAFSDDSQSEIEVLGIKFSFVNDILGKFALPPAGGGGAGYAKTNCCDVISCHWYTEDSPYDGADWSLYVIRASCFDNSGKNHLTSFRILTSGSDNECSHWDSYIQTC